MNVREVINHITNSFLHISSSKNLSDTSLPCIINLLNKSKKEKAQAVEQAFWEFVRGRDSVIILSVSTSSRLFQFILGNVPKIWFINGKVVDQNKRKDVLALLFTHQNLII
ncbi:hypothetical protein IJ556_08105 [bacterium]|nr:hypothetical protein [bacterium]MBR1915116.1 hypothetical protein [Alphaproteobacteria bacterium]